MFQIGIFSRFHSSRQLMSPVSYFFACRLLHSYHRKPFFCLSNSSGKKEVLAKWKIFKPFELSVECFEINWKQFISMRTSEAENLCRKKLIFLFYPSTLAPQWVSAILFHQMCILNGKTEHNWVMLHLRRRWIG
jgi:hypothetical protein